MSAKSLHVSADFERVPPDSHHHFACKQAIHQARQQMHHMSKPDRQIPKQIEIRMMPHHSDGADVIPVKPRRLRQLSECSASSTLIYQPQRIVRACSPDSLPAPVSVIDSEIEVQTEVRKRKQANTSKSTVCKSKWSYKVTSMTRHRGNKPHFFSKHQRPMPPPPSILPSRIPAGETVSFLERSTPIYL